MKKILFILLALVMACSMCACSGAGDDGSKEDPNTLYAGFGRVTCVPDDPLVHIAGGTAKDDPATDGLLDTIEITCVSLKKGDETYLIFTVDIVDVIGYNTTIENTIKTELGIEPENVIFNGTHTHSAPTLKPGDSALPGASNYSIKFHACSVDAARAAVADPPVMILDEATSSIDTRTEKLVQDGMDALMHGRTVFVIAHRLSTIMNSDCIMVLDHGRIIERGTHDELIAKKGTYYKLYTGVFELE